MTPSDHPVAPPAPREGWLRDVGWIALAAAVSVALGSVLVVEFKFRVLDTLTWTSREYAWLAWAGNVMLFLLLLPAVALATWVLYRRVGQALAALVFGFVASFAMLLFVPGGEESVGTGGAP